MHLDHAESAELVREAVRLGFCSVMYDGSALDYHKNMQTTAELVARCHNAEVWVEAELGAIGGTAGVHAPTARTDPAQAHTFVRATGVDARAVAVDSWHAMLARNAALGFGLVGRLMRRYETTPLALLRDIRLRRARELLLHGATERLPTVAAVAAECGFTHLGRFAGVYRRRYGQTPSATMHDAGSRK